MKPDALAAAGMHEVKNMLGQLMLTLDDLAQAGCPGNQQKLDGARVTCQRAAERLVQVLTLYKLGEGAAVLRVDAHSPADLLEDLRLDAAASIPGRIELQLSASQAPPFAFFDRELVQSALVNAIHNALDHARQCVTLSACAAEGGLLFSVEDDGPGYPPAMLGASLDAPQPRNGARGNSTGLGLYFAGMVARAHHNQGRSGEVRLGTSGAGGAHFQLWLP